jgi:hypothetical protein
MPELERSDAIEERREPGPYHRVRVMEEGMIPVC